MSRSIMLVALALAGCFDPSYRANLACGPNESCPPGLRCGADNLCRAQTEADGAVDDAALDDAGSDAAPDAPAVACTADPDCVTPPDLCQTGGTCNLATNTCEYTPVDCASKDGECSRGTCDLATGSCVAEPANFDMTCGSGDTCGAFTPCGGYSATCDSSGTQSRSCTRNACDAAGVCAATPRTETATCTRVTNGVDCATDTVTACGACGSYSDTCDEGGSMSCTCPDFKCQADACQSTATTCGQTCVRDTDGASCGSMTVTNCSTCTFGSACAETGADRTCTCTTFSCGNGACTAIPTTCLQPCTRNTDGDECGCAACGSTGTARIRTCVNGGCTGVMGACGDC